MTESLRNSIQILKLNSVLYKAALDGLSRQELMRSPKEDSNPMIWVAGHILYSRCRLANYLGLQQERSWEKLFARNTSVQPEDAYPALKEILERWNEINGLLKDRFSTLTADELGRPGPFDLPVEAQNLAQGISFQGWHESYHIGQMAYIRKWLGYKSLTG